jgi:hypothetical protein
MFSAANSPTWSAVVNHAGVYHGGPRHAASNVGRIRPSNLTSEGGPSELTSKTYRHCVSGLQLLVTHLLFI